MRYWYIWLPILIIGLLVTFLLVLSDGEEHNVISTKVNLARFAGESSRSVSGSSLSTPRSGGTVGELDLSLIDRIPENCSQPNAGYVKELLTIYAKASEGEVGTVGKLVPFSYFLHLHALEGGYYIENVLLKSYLGWDGTKVDWGTGNTKNLMTNTGQGGTPMDTAYVGYFHINGSYTNLPGNQLTSITNIRHLPTQIAWATERFNSFEGVDPGVKSMFNGLLHNAGPGGGPSEVSGAYFWWATNSDFPAQPAGNEPMKTEDFWGASSHIYKDIMENIDINVWMSEGRKNRKLVALYGLLNSGNWFVPEETLLYHKDKGYDMVGVFNKLNTGKNVTSADEIISYYKGKGSVKTPWEVESVSKQDYTDYFRRYLPAKKNTYVTPYMTNFRAASNKPGFIFRKSTGHNVSLRKSGSDTRVSFKNIPSFGEETLDYMIHSHINVAGRIYANMLTQACVDVDPNNPQTYTKGNIYQGESLTGNIVDMGLPTNSQISLTKVWGKDGKIKISVGGESPELISGLTGNVAVDSGKVVVYNDSGNNGIKITYTGNLTIDASVSERGTIKKGDKLGSIEGVELEIMVEVKGATAEKYPKDLLAKRSYSKNSWYIVDPVSCLGSADLASISVANNVGRIVMDSVGEVCFTSPVYSYEALSVLDEVEVYKQGVGQGDLNSMSRVVVKSVTPGRFKVMN